MEGAAVDALFQRRTAESLRLRANGLVHVYAPWQVVNLPVLARPMVTCTHFAEPAPADTSAPQS